ncbi:AEC family transporter [Calothrix sp. PCC 6303]|uniref:AEC family transporter n=1 Tax=Calothrix sp. PCC 6303 TaxID=1170562 RepID=UPI0002A0441F|nr:AEC family transporter [Calothrix sp. PCC 6303]AFZ00047.1 Auxin Efflux Carrier [Calothrix sp. PCC 6303]
MANLPELYIKLVGLVLLGFILGRILPSIVPLRLGQFLFWFGVPISVVAFLRKADLSGQIWVAPAVAYVALFLGVVLAWLAIKCQGYFGKKQKTSLPKSTQGSLILTSMVGNTGYLGYPIALSIVGTEYFAWALFYDLLGSTIGAYGLGVLIAAWFGEEQKSYWQMAKVILINPTLWSFGLGLQLRQVHLSSLTILCLDTLAWTALTAALTLIGMRLSQIQSWDSLPLAAVSVAVKMIIVPLIISAFLPLLGITGKTALVIILQMAMPPAFASLILAEAFNLDRQLTVSAIALGSAFILLTLPVWILITGN